MARNLEEMNDLLDVLTDYDFLSHEFTTQRRDLCVLPELEQTHPVIFSNPLIVENENGVLVNIPRSEPRILLISDELTSKQTLVMAKYGSAELVSSSELFPEGYLNED